MAVRRLNYTGRQSIRRSHVQVTLREPEHGSPTFDASIDLSFYNLPDDALVFVEAQRQTSYMRFDFGTAGSIEPPGDRMLSEFDSAEGIQFRVKVTARETDESRRAMLLAAIDRIRTVRQGEELDSNCRPLLVTVPDDTLGSQVCRVHFGEGDPVELRINSQLGNWKSAVLRPAFKALVFPMAFKEILTRFVIIDDVTDPGDGESVGEQWLKFALTLPGVGEIPSGTSNYDQLDDWIDDAVAAFCRRSDMINLASPYLTGETDR